MKRLFLMIVFTVFWQINHTSAQIIHIPEDYPTIQEGINAASEGDTVLVSPGTYYENISMNGTNITLASFFLTTNDTSYISSTIIDGDQNGSVITIDQEEDPTTRVCGFSITNGFNVFGGGGILINNADPSLDHLYIFENRAVKGGGLLLNSSYCTIDQVRIVNNYCESIGYLDENGGGGLFISTNNNDGHVIIKNSLIAGNSTIYEGGGVRCSNTLLELENTDIIGNVAQNGGGIYFMHNFLVMDTVNRCNIYLNSAIIGNDLYLYTGGPINVVVDTFTVMNPTEFHAYPLFYYTFDILNSKLNQVENDLFVSPDGNNDNSGLTADDPLKTIHHALSIILATENAQRQIHLLDGTYSPNTNGELFPLDLIDYIHLSGTADSLVILDADSASRVMQIQNNDTNHVSDLTLTGGYAGSGAGLYINYSDPLLERLIITGNTAVDNGGGMYCEISNAAMNDLRISGNTSYSNGGGIFLQQSSPVLNHVTVSQNTATGLGGGVNVANYSSNPVFENVLISENNAPMGAGIYNSGNLKLIECDVTGNTGIGDGGGIYTRGSLRLVHTEVRENTAESGGGIFVKASTSAWLDTVNVSENTASYQGGGLCCEGGANTWLNKVNVSVNNSAMYGGGIYCESNSNLFLSGSTISYNHADNAGGGMMWWSYISTHFDSTDRSNIYLNSGGIGSDLFYSSSYDTIEIIVDTFTVIYPTDYHVEYKSKFNFDILNGKLEQADADLYVSPDGDNSDTGLTPDDPLKTIYRAFSKIRADRDHQHTIHLADGVYSPSANGEFYPLHAVNHNSLSGESRLNTILDAEQTGLVLDLYYDTIPRIENLTVTGGNSPYTGAGIDCYNTEVDFNNIRIAGNISELDGGGIYIGFCDNIALKNMIIEDNEAIEDGGGIYVWKSKPEMINLEIKNNSAVNGGGIYLDYLDTVTMDKMIFTANTASNNGGAIYAINSKYLTITSSEINANTAWKGGGMWTEGTSPIVKNSLIANNTALQHSGGIGIYNDDYSPSGHESGFYNVTFANNSAPALFCYSAGVRLINSIFWDNANQYQIQYAVAGEDDDTLRVSNTDIQNGLNGIYISGTPIMEWPEGNIDEDPQFLLSGDFPYALDAGSPCIDTGTQDTTGLFLPFNDLIGNTRVWDGDGNGSSIIDMGPYEYGAPVTVPEEGHLNKLNAGNTYIFPNPAKDHLTICSDDTRSGRMVTIFNSTGQVVNSLLIPSGQGKLLINLDHFTQGLYTLLFSHESGVYSVMKVVVID